MKELSKIFASYKESGIYNLKKEEDTPELEAMAVAPGYSLFRIDLTGMLTKEGFLRATAKALQFPPYFGTNWDALEDCLKDFEWCTAMGYVIIYEAAAPFAEIAPDELKMAKNIYKSAVKFWKKQKKPFYVFLVD
jgi:hypothetical protein